MPDRDEYRDGLDIRLSALVCSLGFLPISMSNGVEDVPGYLDSINPDGFILSGGNDIGQAPQRDRLEYAILDYAEANNRPVIGICRGLQIINQRQGGQLHLLEGHVAQPHLITGKRLGPDRTVNSFHNFGVHIQDLGKDLQAIGFAPDGTVEAIRHVELPWLAIMWHPERNKNLVSADRKLLLETLAGVD